jgi:23S rRNA (adenine2503-C2)-methyltransferase
MKQLSEERERLDLLGLGRRSIEEEMAPLIAALGEPGYRARQVAAWTFDRLAVSFDEMTNLPAALRARLSQRFTLRPLALAFEARSEDGTVKHLWNLRDGHQVESVLIPAGDRVTLCLSSQAGCALACRFCATGDMGFRRQLSAAEIVAQYRDSERLARDILDRGIANVVYMGMGEPLANQDAVFDSLTVLHQAFGLGARRITVSTVGLVPGIRALAARPEPFRLAVSLHAPNHELRLRLVPVEKRYPLPELFAALREYQALKGRRITFEYVLISETNDSRALAAQLAELVGSLDAFVNLIPCNPVPGRDWIPSSPLRQQAFLGVLEARGVPAAIRQPRGRDIAAACGQLRLERGTSQGGSRPIGSTPGPDRSGNANPDRVSPLRRDTGPPADG